jgi:hypothetical protein
MRCAIQGACVLLVVGLAGCSNSRQARERSQVPPPPPEPYVRVAGNGSNLVRLEIALRELVPKSRRMPAVWLCGVSHVGDRDYYTALQRELDTRTLVLYEGISPQRDAPSQPTESPEGNEPGPIPPPGQTNAQPRVNRASLQSNLASSLDLVFQLEAIDYTRRNFRNSDLSLQELRGLLAEGQKQSGRTGAAQGFDTLVQAMEGGSFLNTLLDLALRFVAGSPKLQALGRLMLIDILAEVQGDPSRIQGLSPELKELVNVLVQRRNEKVLADLASEARHLGRSDSIALFYGAGHMADLESRLRRDSGYRPGRELWLTAFSVDLAQARIKDSERELIKNLIKNQLQAASAAGPGK